MSSPNISEWFDSNGKSGYGKIDLVTSRHSEHFSSLIAKASYLLYSSHDNHPLSLIYSWKNKPIRNERFRDEMHQFRCRKKPEAEVIALKDKLVG